MPHYTLCYMYMNIIFIKIIWKLADRYKINFFKKNIYKEYYFKYSLLFERLLKCIVQYINIIRLNTLSHLLIVIM
jgi:hypothetical protein